MPDNNTYYSNINKHLLAICPDANNVLEFGCGAGQFMAAYKQKHAHAFSVGVELFNTAAKDAEQIFDKVIVGNTEELDLSAHQVEQNSFDLLIYGDVLEHFVDPWTALEKHLHFLKPGGTVCICVPNIAHWSIIFGLLNGSFEYRDQGLLDRTHMRFFTRSSLKDLIMRAGLTIETIDSIIINKKKTEQAITTLAKLFGKPAEDLNPARRKDWATYQYLIRAHKPQKT